MKRPSWASFILWPISGHFTSWQIYYLHIYIFIYIFFVVICIYAVFLNVRNTWVLHTRAPAHTKIRGKGTWSYFGFLVDVVYQNIKLDFMQIYAYSTVSRAIYVCLYGNQYRAISNGYSINILPTIILPFSELTSFMSIVTLQKYIGYTNKISVDNSVWVK